VAGLSGSHFSNREKWGTRREHRKLTQEQLAKKAKVSRALIAAIETKRKTGSVGTWKKLGAVLDVGWELLA